MQHDDAGCRGVVVIHVCVAGSPGLIPGSAACRAAPQRGAYSICGAQMICWDALPCSSRDLQVMQETDEAPHSIVTRSILSRAVHISGGVLADHQSRGERGRGGSVGLGSPDGRHDQIEKQLGRPDRRRSMEMGRDSAHGIELVTISYLSLSIVVRVSSSQARL